MRVRNGQILTSNVSLSANNDKEIALQESARLNEFLQGRTLHEIRDWKTLLSQAGVSGGGTKEELGEVGVWLNRVLGIP
ncbi:MAG: Biotin/lipoate A/B protein ligase [Watsoniomyces obsoletus]|nr:MAG: Biotin/lipoate A/B protein ligase [Watsoniomyces obsoletus]